MGASREAPHPCEAELSRNSRLRSVAGGRAGVGQTAGADLSRRHRRAGATGKAISRDAGARKDGGESAGSLRHGDGAPFFYSASSGCRAAARGTCGIRSGPAGSGGSAAREDEEGPIASQPLMSAHAAARLRHALRTPLNHIIGYAEMVEEDAKDRSAAILAAIVYEVRGIARRIMDAVN